MIVAGDYDAPILALTKTLKNIKLILSGDAKITMPLAPEESRKCQMKMSNSNEMMDCDQKEEDKMSSKTSAAFEYDFYHSSEDHSSCFLSASVAVNTRGRAIEKRTVSIFQNPLIVKGDCFDVPLDSHLCEELSCVAIYNLALAHQLKAIAMADAAKAPEHRDLPNSRAYLFKALSLFEYSHQIFKQQSVPVRMPALHCMALVSNLGQIHHLFGDQARTNQCHEYMLSVLMYAIDAERVRNQRLPERDQLAVDGFLEIVQHLVISKEDSVAPAA